MPRHTLALSFLYFCYALFVAHRQGWQAHDIVWSMWVSSLIGGYLIIVLSILSGLRRPNPQAVPNNAAKGKGIGHALFLLLFFTVHFGGFHFVHGQIMQGFFPLAETDLNFWSMLQKTASDYWYFVVVAALNLFPRITDLWRSDSAVKPSFELPYKAVIRNHLMIFVVAFAQNFVATPVLLYLLLLLYFFPLEEFLAWREQRKKKGKPDAPIQPQAAGWLSGLMLRLANQISHQCGADSNIQ